MPGPCPDSFRVSGYPGIHVNRVRRKGVDGRNKYGHDVSRAPRKRRQTPRAGYSTEPPTSPCPPPPRRRGNAGGTAYSPSPPPSQARGASARRLRDVNKLEVRAGVRWGRAAPPAPVQARELQRKRLAAGKPLGAARPAWPRLPRHWSSVCLGAHAGACAPAHALRARGRPARR